MQLKSNTIKNKQVNIVTLVNLKQYKINVQIGENNIDTNIYH